ncbi:MAG: hypothetical protein WEB03_01120 [Nitriliruptor sp.]|uniref:hypothetical protein n=1 Tax=Nitriliruptor sp. TaxID=2448056 RepID=UPI00349FE4D7
MSTTAIPQRPELPVQQPARTSPFGGAAPSLRTAVAYLVAAVVWVTVGEALPGGRWFAVHLFTLGTLTNLILVFSDHFSRTLTRTPAHGPRWPLPVLNLGILLVLVAIPTGRTVPLALGATVTSGVVIASYVRIRRLRRASIGARFTWIVRNYERAHGAFVHGAVLGALLGAGALAGAWRGPARLAHLHLNVLGWAGLTLLSTLVFFGPTITRCRILPEADERAARALRHGATGLTAAALLLLATGFGGDAALPLRLGAAAGLAVYAWAATVTCLAVLAAVLRAQPSATQAPIAAVCLWFTAAVWADVAIVATGAWHLLDALGVALIVGVLVPTITATLTYLAPLLRGPTAPVRALITDRLAAGAELRTIVANTAAVILVVTAALGTTLGVGGWWMVRGAWLALVAVIVPPLLFAIARPRPALVES